VAGVIRPALAATRIVLCDRYDDSTLAYQGGGRGLDMDLLRVLNRAATGGLTPDLTLLFDLDPAAGLARRELAKGSVNRLDREPEAFHARVRARYLELAAAEPRRFVVLNGALAPALLEAEVWAALEPRLITLGV
jgi:dTMP kinase